MKKIINLYGGPGAGKSTTAANIFYQLKIRGIETELAREYAKNWVWEGRKIQDNDQIYIAAKQCRAEAVLFKDVDVIITDSPVRTAQFYEEVKGDTQVVRHIVDAHERLAAANGFQQEHVVLTRGDYSYQEKGRLHNAQEAKQIDQEMRVFLLENSIDPHVVQASSGAALQILKLAGLIER